MVRNPQKFQFEMRSGGRRVWLGRRTRRPWRGGGTCWHGAREREKKTLEPEPSDGLVNS
jgi:hypothetical protein